MKNLWPGLGGPLINYITTPPADLPSMRRIAVLGSTGSIGRNVLDVARKNSRELKVIALAGGRNMREMPRQAAEFEPASIAMQSGEIISGLAARLDYKPKLSSGRMAYAEMAAMPEADLIVSAQSGGAGLSATLAAALAGKTICLANKESLVLAGPLVRSIAARTHASILPVDSEHNAIFQCLAGRGQNIAKIILTASGGPFFGKSRNELANVGPEDALKHPNWQMGRKITIDSSTMMNKTLELIEAVQLFGIEEKRIEILIQPQSVIHSMVQLADGSIIAQLATPDMRLPIAFCLLWPHSGKDVVKELDLAKTGKLDFARPDGEVFPALPLGREVLQASPERGLSPACIVLNAANELCVELFLNRRISWPQITDYTRQAVNELGHKPLPETVIPETIPSEPVKIAELAIAMADEIMRLDHRTRQFILKLVAENEH